MCAWRVLAMLRRVACVGACHNLSPPYRARFCCAAALGARVHRCGNIGTFVIIVNNLDTNPSLYIYVHRGSSLTSIFSVFLRRSQMADSRQRAESKTLQVGPCACACCTLSLRRRVAFYCHSMCHVLLFSCSLVLRYVPHLTQHVPLLASWRSLIIWSSNCDALLEIIHIMEPSMPLLQFPPPPPAHNAPSFPTTRTIA